MIKTITLDDLLSQKMADTDINLNTPAHNDITEMLNQCGLDVAAWSFQSIQNSHSARSTQDGGHETCPALRIIFRYTKDVTAENIDTHNGNWNDEWTRTSEIRTKLNKILDRYNFNSNFISSRTFLFVQDSWEDIAHDFLGRTKKNEIARMISETIQSQKTGFQKCEIVKPKYIFWHSSKKYYVILEDEQAFMKSLPYKKKIETFAANILSRADPKKHCLDHRVKMSFHHLGMKDLNLYGMSRED